MASAAGQKESVPDPPRGGRKGSSPSSINDIRHSSAAVPVTSSKADTDINEQFIEQYEQLSIEMGTKPRPDVAAAGPDKRSKADDISKGDDHDEQRDVDESLTLSMLMDGENERADVAAEDQTSTSGGTTIDSYYRNAGGTSAIEDAASNPSEIDQWIETVKQQSRERPSSTVYYEENMPDLRDLATRVWSEEFAEAAHRSGTIIDPDLDLTLEEYAQVVCALLDVPVYEGNIIQSLHMVMSLFLELEGPRQVRI